MRISDWSSDMCSSDLGGSLELFATRGLKQEAVYVTRLALGEGLVGMIAEQIETLNLDEAAAHPAFSSRPETGEDVSHIFAGVPIIRRELAVGVSWLQHSDPRSNEEIKIEPQQTVPGVRAAINNKPDL